MIYNREGEILWHRGREIHGRTVSTGNGYPKSHVEQTLTRHDIFEQENVFMSAETSGVTESAYVLQIKSLIIYPISDQFFLYLDSGAREFFSETDREIFKIIGQLLGEVIRQVRKSQDDVGGITGNSPAISRIKDQVLKYSIEEEPVLLLGETGVGKSRVAELIHRYSGRKGKFVTVNIPNIPDTLFESELFGHKKGAFTDARSDKTGFVQEAEGGTLFLDEISEIPLHFQAKLLRFIETRKYNILGDSSEITADIRIVAATNKNLQEAMKEKQFREDLYYRLHILEILIPPLRNRKEDIKKLIHENMGMLKGKEPGDGFWEAFSQYHWPGNIRELMTVLIRTGIHAASPVTGGDVNAAIRQSQTGGYDSGAENRMDQYIDTIRSGKNFWNVVWEPFIKREFNVHEVRELLTGMYEQHQFSLKKLSRALHIEEKDYKKFIAILHKYPIHPGKK